MGSCYSSTKSEVKTGSDGAFHQKKEKELAVKFSVPSIKIPIVGHLYLSICVLS